MISTATAPLSRPSFTANLLPGTALGVTRAALSILGLALVIPGCVSVDDRASPTGADSNGGGCAPEECGTNGAILADRRFSPIDLDGGDNGSDLFLIGALTATGDELAIDVVDSHFVGRSWEHGAITARDSELLGTRILVTRRTESEDSEWILSIHEVTTLSYLSDESGAIPGYRMTYAPASEPENQQDMCADGAPVTLVTGERYDAASLAIDATASGRWLELACPDHLLGKAKRMSYDPSKPEGHRYYTTPAQRRATLAMLAADYCGDGQRFTTPGTPLSWRNRADWMVVGSAPAEGSQLEAGWDQFGAVCLNTPRRSDVYPRADIEAACGRFIPACTPELLQASEWVTWSPT